MRQLNLGIVGCGTVGCGAYRALQRNGRLLASRLGVHFHVSKVAVRDLRRKRAVKIPEKLLTTQWLEVVRDPGIDLVLELMGGTTTARSVVLGALERGKAVVTANKALLSAHGPELFAAARRNRVGLYFEASVAGGIPIIKILREGLVGNEITRIYGILNGTCNYILTRMKEEGFGFDSVLADAQRLGFAEAEPSLDVDGFDAMHKTGILASLAHGFWADPGSIHVEGIRNVTQLDIRFAAALGYTIKLLGIIKKHDVSHGSAADGVVRIQASVCPTLVPDSHVLASVNHVFNAVFVRGDIVGDTLFYGRGAGPDATASAILSDLGDAALDLADGAGSRRSMIGPEAAPAVIVPMGEVISRYYLRLTVVDRPGTLARISAILAEAQIGISSVIQPEGHEGQSVPLILMIHDAANAAMERALRNIRKLPVVKAPPVMFRVESFE